MDVQPIIRLDNIDETALAMVKFVTNTECQKNARSTLAARWKKYVEFRQLALAKSIEAVCNDGPFGRYVWKAPAG